MIDFVLGRSLLAVARRAIAGHLGAPGPEPVDHDGLQRPGASFVTLTLAGELRGCIGSLQAYRALAVDVAENALGAAFRDPRFAPLDRFDFDRIGVEVSLLSSSTPVAAADEEELLARLRPGTDGLILEFGPYRSTFLPQVWESLPEPRQFVAYLKRKAGLPADFWAPDVRISRYEVTKWKESELQALQ